VSDFGAYMRLADLMPSALLVAQRGVVCESPSLFVEGPR